MHDRSHRKIPSLAMFVRLEAELQSVENTVGTAAIRLPKPRAGGNELLTERHREIAGRIWEIANRLRGPYRPPQYRLVMLPMVVLRRLDCVLAPSKDAVIKEHARLKAAGTPASAVPRLLTKIVDNDRSQPLYNISPYT